VGDQFTVYGVGEQLVDPSTGEVLGSDEEEIGDLKISVVKDKFSIAMPVGNIAGVKPGDIVRAQ